MRNRSDGLGLPPSRRRRRGPGLLVHRQGMKMRLITWYGMLIIAGLYGLHRFRR